MTASMTIKRVADATGFTPSTLRYYEEIGLLPAPQRSAAGYRTYDADDVVARLAFIARAKQLGCTLDEIVRLNATREGGRCGPVQDQLRALVEAKAVDAERQAAELAAFASELRAALATLDGHRPVGACDDQCGCATPSSLSAAPVAFGLKGARS